MEEREKERGTHDLATVNYVYKLCFKMQVELGRTSIALAVLLEAVAAAKKVYSSYPPKGHASNV
jgi:hypothetical protein